MRQCQVVAHTCLSQALFLVSPEPRCLGTCRCHGCDPLDFFGGQRQVPGLIQEYCTAWITTP